MPLMIPGWNRSQRGVLIALISVILIWLSVKLWRNSAYVSDPQPDKSARYDELQDRIDPNEAEWQAIAALPQLGEKRAKAIVAFREKFVADHPGRRAFDRASDLLQIRGIGKVMLETIEPHLRFPATQPTSRP